MIAYDSTRTHSRAQTQLSLTHLHKRDTYPNTERHLRDLAQTHTYFLHFYRTDVQHLRLRKLAQAETFPKTCHTLSHMSPHMPPTPTMPTIGCAISGSMTITGCKCMCICKCMCVMYVGSDVVWLSYVPFDLVFRMQIRPKHN